MAKIKNTMTVSLEEFGKKAGEYALDEFEYKGLTIRQWADKIANGEYQPVKHGRWIDFPECLAYEGALDEEYFVCSECHHVWNTVDNCAETFRYCPNCGSKNEDGDSDD